MARTTVDQPVHCVLWCAREACLKAVATSIHLSIYLSIYLSTYPSTFLFRFSYPYVWRVVDGVQEHNDQGAATGGADPGTPHVCFFYVIWRVLASCLSIDIHPKYHYLPTSLQS